MIKKLNDKEMKMKKKGKYERSKNRKLENKNNEIKNIKKAKMMRLLKSNRQ